MEEHKANNLNAVRFSRIDRKNLSTIRDANGGSISETIRRALEIHAILIQAEAVWVEVDGERQRLLVKNKL